MKILFFMKKTIENVRELAKEVFKPRWFAGRITHNRNSINVWSRGIISCIVATIIPDDNLVYLGTKRYEIKARRFGEIYHERFSEELVARKLYD